jgi:hypothetical protein
MRKEKETFKFLNHSILPKRKIPINIRAKTIVINPTISVIDATFFQFLLIL